MNRLNQTALLLAVTVLVGCGVGKSRFEYIPVRGTVTLDGKPLSIKNIFLFPEKGVEGLGSKALTNKDGAFELEAVVGGATAVIKGAVAGKYLVVVSDFTIDPGTPEDIQQPQPTTPAVRVPSVYSSADTTPLRLEVTPDMKDVAFELKSKAR
jgi:hypothetical protein